MTRSSDCDLLIVGGGPCGIAAAISAQRAGLEPLVIEAQVICSTIAQYPTYVRFFSTAEKLSVGDVPFVVHSRTSGGVDHETRAKNVVIATGYFGSPNKISVPGEDLPHVTHIYREGHEAFLQSVVVVGGGNSAAEAALDLWRSGASVTLVHFGPTFDKKIKPWVLPDFENRVKEGRIAARWNSRVRRIERECVTIQTDETMESLDATRVYLMTGFAPDLELLRQIGVSIDPKTGIPAHNPDTLETEFSGVFIAGVVVAGFDANKVFIENGRYHGDKIVARILGTKAPAEPQLSAELDT